ncbi:MAG: lysophospholipid acyltransferase family protein [Crocinitomicaceae bacterium]
MFSWLLFHFILIPLSWLPITILYFISNLAYLIVYRIIGYRKSVVINNLSNSFPKKTKTEIDLISKAFYKHLSYLLAESIKNLTISRQSLLDKLTVVNPELMNTLFEEKKSVILLGNHMYNWEYLISAQNLLFKHQAIGIGTPLSNSVLNEKINNKRARFGMKITTNENYKSIINSSKNTPTATLVLGDQSPSKSANAYWTVFLNRQTPFFFGAEIMANEMNSAVVYCQLEMTTRGVYQLTLKEITKNPTEEQYGKILSTYANYLQEDILNAPSYWLWSHKRWKMQIPEDIESTKAAHKKRFLKKFRS